MLLESAFNEKVENVSIFFHIAEYENKMKKIEKSMKETMR